MSLAGQEVMKELMVQEVLQQRVGHDAGPGTQKTIHPDYLTASILPS
jgi:hypothetical protein